MSLIADFKTLYHLTCAPVVGRTHGDRLDSFYRRQAAGYDDFRTRLLRGRECLMHDLHVPDGGTWVDLGGGTASNLEAAASWLPRLSQVYVVDLADSLLEIARQR